MADVATLGLRVDAAPAIASLNDFARAGANAAQAAQLTGVSLDKARIAVQVYGGSIPKTTAEIAGLAAAHEELAEAGINVAKSTTGAIGGLGRLSTELIGLAAHETGTLRVFDQIGSTLLHNLGVEGPVLLAVFAGVAAVGFAYDKLTESSKKMREEQDKLTESLKKWYDTETAGVAADRLREVANAKATLAVQQQHLALLQQQHDSPTFNRSEGVNASIEKGLADTQRQIEEQKKLIAAGAADVDRIQSAAFDAEQAREAQILASRLQFDADDETARKDAIEALRRDQALYKQYMTLPDTVENSARVADYAGIIKTLTDALNPKDHVTVPGFVVQSNAILDALDKQIAEMRKGDAQNNASLQHSSDLTAQLGLQGYALEMLAHAQQEEAANAKARLTQYGDELERTEAVNAQIRKEADERTRLTTVLKDQQAAAAALNALVGAIKSGVDPTVAWRAVMDAMGKSLGLATTSADKMEQIWIKGIESIAEHGLQSFTSFFDQVLNLFRRLMDQMQKEGQSKGGAYKLLGLASAGITGGLAGYSIGQSTGDTGIGVVGGAAAGAAVGSQILPGWGTVIGGLAGAAGGLLGAADAQKSAAQKMQDAAIALGQSITAYSVSASDPVTQQLTGNRLTSDALRKQATDYVDDQVKGFDSKLAARVAAQMLEPMLTSIKNSFETLNDKIKNDFIGSLGEQLNALSGPSGAYSNALDGINKRYQQNLESARALGLGEAGAAESTDIYRKSIDQLNDSLAQAADSTLLQRLFSITGGSALSQQDPNAALRAALASTTDPKTIAFLQQQIEMNEKFSKYLDGLQAQKDAAQSAADSLARQTQVDEAILKTQQDALQVNQQSLNAAKSALTQLQQVVAGLQATRDALKLGSLTTLSPAQQLIESRRQFSDLVAKAMTGDQTAAGGLSGAANSYLGASRAYNASGLGYVSDYNSVQAALGAVQDQFGAQVDTQQQIVDLLQAANDKLAAQILILQVQTQAAGQSAAQAQANTLLQQLNNHGGNPTSIIDQLHQLGYQVNEDFSTDSSGLSTPGSFYLSNFGGPGANGAALYAAILAQARQYQDAVYHGIVPGGAATPGQMGGDLPGYANGSDYTPDSFIAGERGPEIITNRPGNRVINAQQLAAGSGDVAGAIAKLERRFEQKFDALVKATNEQTLEMRHRARSAK